MSKTCQACGGAVCEACGGCIAHGECSCIEDQIASYKEQIESLRAARVDDQKLIEALQARHREISALISSRHGDDGRFCEPEDEYNDDPETITIKRLFAIIEGDVTPGEVFGPGGYYDSGAR